MQQVIHGTDILSSADHDFLLCWQQHHRALDDISLPSLHTHSDDIQNIIHRIKSAEIAHLVHNKYPERVRGERGEYRQRIILITHTNSCINDLSCVSSNRILLL